MKLIKIIFYLVGLGLILALAGVGVLYHIYNTQLPSVDELGEVRYQMPMRIHDREGGLMAEFGDQRRFPVSFDEIPPVVVDAFVAAEDDRFFEHVGVDFLGLARAAIELVRTGEKSQGGSTITMQVARNFYLGREKTYTRKLYEILLAIKIDRAFSKEDILALYLNKIFMGHRAYGVKAAAQVYFDKDLPELTVAEAAMLAALPKAPSTTNPVSDPERALARRAYVLGRMLKLGQIDQATFDRSIDEPLPGRLYTSAEVVTRAPYAAEMARRDLVEEYGDEAYEMGIAVQTSIDPEAQASATRALRRALIHYDRRHGYRGPEADWSEWLDDREALEEQLAETDRVGGLLPAVVLAVDANEARVLVRDAGEINLGLEAMDWACEYRDVDRCGPKPKAVDDVLERGALIRVEPTESEEGTAYRLAQIPEVTGAFAALDPSSGAIRAMVGGFDFFHDSEFNNVTRAERQPGSGFKPYLYSAALDQGFTWASMINDSPVVVEDGVREGIDWRPSNYGRSFGGMRRMREALTRSVNLVSIRLAQAVGTPAVLDYAGRFGLPVDEWKPTLSMALGSYTLTPLDQVAGFAVFANGGYRVSPFLVTEVDNPDDGVIYSHPAVSLCDNCPADTADPSLAPRVITAQNAFLMRSGLRSVVREGTAVRAWRALQREDIGGKTGTTNDQRDAWFSGFGPGWVAVAWVGFADNSELGRRETGGKAALPMWIDFMGDVLPPAAEPEEPPEGIVTAWIDPDTGKRVPEGHPGAIREYFDATNPQASLPEEDAAAASGTSREVIENLF
ncbi:PBP1A family penicillin-binding protein [Guyparkeria halophila]|uniref:Penicillin-binding protein 1A n=1 Tax=Guyparkeria halophila TaxID=47960 RepID=A0A6I6D263_9GAMM|nr:PBP1A family penicillin-binding protein [Guyparkeria halophila]